MMSSSQQQHQQLIQFCLAEFENEYKYFLGGGPVVTSGEVSIASLYIEARGGTTEHSTNETDSFSLISRLSSELNQVDNNNSIYSFVILGSSGSGKSSLALALTKYYWDAFNDGKSDQIPIYISLPKMSKHLDNILGKYFKGAAYVTEFCRSNKLLLILDSYDEIHGENPSNLWNVNQWGGIDFLSIKMVTFSRPEVFSSISELKFKFDAVLSKGAAINAQNSSILHKMYYMQSFTKNEIHQYIRLFCNFLTQLRQTLDDGNETDYDGYWSSILLVINELGWKDIEEEIKDWMKKIVHLTELGTNPYLLYLILQSLPKMIQKYQDEEQKLKSICSTKAGVYDEFTHQWFSYQVKRTQHHWRI